MSVMALISAGKELAYDKWIYCDGFYDSLDFSEEYDCKDDVSDEYGEEQQ